MPGSIILRLDRLVGVAGALFLDGDAFAEGAIYLEGVAGNGGAFGEGQDEFALEHAGGVVDEAQC